MRSSPLVTGIGYGTPNDVTIRFRGVRGSLPAPALENMRYGGNTSCVEVRCGDQLLILDAGSGIRRLGEDLVRDAGGSPIRTTLLLSHTHWDHIQGLPFFAPGYSAENRIRILGAYGHGPQLQQALVNQMIPAHFPVGFEAMRGIDLVEELAPGSTELGNVTIRTTQLNHPGGCTGFRIETPSGVIAYLPDHEPYGKGLTHGHEAALSQRGLIAFLEGADTLILDTQYTVEEYPQRVGWGHGCIPDSVQLGRDAGVARLVLFHHDPSHNDEQLDRMVETARALASDISLTIGAASENEPLFLPRTRGAETPEPERTRAKRATSGNNNSGDNETFGQPTPQRALGML